MTKSFTAITVAAMVDEGKLDWDKPVRDYLPWFQLFDPVATSRPQVELYVRWMHELRRYSAWTVSRRLSIVAGFTGPA